MHKILKYKFHVKFPPKKRFVALKKDAYGLCKFLKHHKKRENPIYLFVVFTDKTAHSLQQKSTKNKKKTKKEEQE